MAAIEKQSRRYKAYNSRHETCVSLLAQRGRKRQEQQQAGSKSLVVLQGYWGRKGSRRWKTGVPDE